MERRSFRVWTTLLSLLVLLGLTAYSSRSGFGHSTNARPTPGYINWAVSIFLVVFVLMIPFAIYIYWIQMREFRAKQESRSFQSRVARSLGFLVLAMLAGVVIVYLRRHGLSLNPLQRFLDPNAGNGRNGHRNLPATQYHPTFRWPVLWATLVLLAAATGYIGWRRSRATPIGFEVIEEETVAEAVAASIDGALDDLESEPDARRAVIAAYARMERVLARVGLQRKDSETSLEYLRRVLLGLTTRTDAVSRLTALFEQAKFSRHEIDGTMKQDAIDSLRAIRDNLRQAET